MLFHSTNVSRQVFYKKGQGIKGLRGRVLALFMVLVMLLGGCSMKQSDSIPELLEPVAGNRFYRPVTKRMVAQPKQLYATVVPREYSQFFSVAGTIKEIYVSMGDYVKKGDVLAELDLTELKRQYEAVKEELSYEKSHYQQQQKIFGIKEQMLKEQTSEGEEQEEAASGDGKKSLLLKQQEEKRYAEEQYGNQQKEKQEQLSQMEAALQDGTLHATKSGYVNYVKDLSQSEELTLYETVVLICDAKKACLTIREHSMNEEAYSDCEAVYIKEKQERTSLTPISYSNKELAYMEAVKSYPSLCYELPENSTLTFGAQVVVYYEKNMQEEKPCIGLDSLYEEGQELYVYVRMSEEGTMTEEKRRVTLGQQDEHYAQVLAGVSEGEWVRYENLSLQPTESTGKKITFADYTTTLSSERCTWVSTKKRTVHAGEELMIQKVYAKKGDKVKENTPLFSVKQMGGKADIAALNIQIKRQKKSISDAMKEYRKQKMEQEAQESIDPLSYQLLKEEYNLTIMEQQRQLTMFLEELALLRQENDGSGETIYYARAEGELTDFYVEEGAKYKEGATLYTLDIPSKKQLKVELDNKNEALSLSNTAKLFSKVKLSTKDSSEEGSCVFNYMQETTHICTRNKEVVESRIVEEEERCFYADTKLAEKKTPPTVTKVDFSGKQVKQVILLSSIYIHQEDNLVTGNNSYFVWKLIDDELVKEYITLDEGMLKGDAVIIYTGLEENDVVV